MIALACFVMMMRAESEIEPPDPARLAITHLLQERHAMTATYPNVPGVTFKMIPDFPGYCAGDDGSVWSSHPRGTKRGPDGWKNMVGYENFGYRYVLLSRDGKKSHHRVHRLVLLAFVGSPPADLGPGQIDGCHFPDRNKANNRLENLRWDTSKANKADMKVHGTRRYGSRLHNAKLNESLVRLTRSLALQGESHRSIAARLGVEKSAVSRVLKGETWAHVE